VKTLQDWLTEQQIGRPGSAKRLAWECRNALRSIFALPMGKEEMHERIDKALESLDADFLQTLTDGVRELKKAHRLDTTGAELRYCHLRTYMFLMGQKGILFFDKKSHRALTTLLYCTAKETQSEPPLPLPEYPEEVQKKIDKRVEKFPEQKWSRLDSDVGVSMFLAPARPGRPKKKKN
jgi:hypothetical protein